MKTTIFLMAIVAGALFASPTSASTALNALKVIPDAALSNLAIIEGHDGNPTPERWHFLFYDPATENGVREYVIQDGKIVAEREISQFATALRPTDTVGAMVLSVDSDMVARTAQRFAKANGLEISKMHFALRKDDIDGGPLWSVVCVAADGRAFASLIVSGDEGRIVSHEGFPIDPATVVARSAPGAKAARQSRDSNPKKKSRVVERSRRDRPHAPDPIEDVIKPLHRLVRSLLPF